MDSTPCKNVYYYGIRLLLSLILVIIEKNMPVCVWNEICVMRGARQCMVEELHGQNIVKWIACSTCGSWYHDACVGISVDALPSANFRFSCCSGSSIYTSQPISMFVFIMSFGDYYYYVSCCFATAKSLVG